MDQSLTDAVVVGQAAASTPPPSPRDLRCVVHARRPRKNGRAARESRYCAFVKESPVRISADRRGCSTGPSGSSGKPLDLTTGATDSGNDEFPLEIGEAGAFAALTAGCASSVSEAPPPTLREFMARSSQGVTNHSPARSAGPQVTDNQVGYAPLVLSDGSDGWRKEDAVARVHSLFQSGRETESTSEEDGGELSDSGRRTFQPGALAWGSSSGMARWQKNIRKEIDSNLARVNGKRIPVHLARVKGPKAVSGAPTECRAHPQAANDKDMPRIAKRPNTAAPHYLSEGRSKLLPMELPGDPREWTRPQVLAWLGT